MGKYSRIVLAAVMVVAFTGYADAQYMSYRVAGYGYRQSPEVNNYLSARSIFSRCILTASPRSISTSRCCRSMGGVAIIRAIS
jgi:hypothetical protein